MEPKPYISLFRGRVNEPRQAVNENHNYCAIVLATYELRDALRAKMSQGVR